MGAGVLVELLCCRCDVFVGGCGGGVLLCAVSGTLCSWWGLEGGKKANEWKQASTNLTESITAGKYPEYKEYQMRVNRFIPGLATLKGGDEMRVKKDL